MELKVFLLLSFAALAFAVPAKVGQSEDMMTSEGRSLHSYAPPPVPSHGGAIVTSYHRRGAYAQASDISRPSIYGSRYSAHQAVGSAPYPAAPVAYAPAPVQRYPAPELGHSSAQNYGPQRNAFSEESRHLSQDPNYDPARDPVSQYAAYIPAFEPKSRATGNELSLYGYRKK